MSAIDIRSMSTNEFVKCVAKVYRSHGFQTEIPSDDEFGVDLVIAAEGGLTRTDNGLFDEAGRAKRMVVRCERSPRPIDFTPVAVIHAAQDMYSASIAAVVADSSFTPPAFKLARHYKVYLISRYRLLRMYELSFHEISVPQLTLPGKHVCALCYEADSDWSDYGVYGMCGACALAVQNREAKVVVVESDSLCAFCGANLYAGDRACVTKKTGKEILYCLTALCMAQHLAFAKMMNP